MVRDVATGNGRHGHDMTMTVAAKVTTKASTAARWARAKANHVHGIKPA